jgi:hypothetical protein
VDKTEFLALRREALVIACDREYFGGVEPIPVLPPCPGFYVPIPDGLNERLALMEKARDAQRAGHKGQRYNVGNAHPPKENLASKVRKAGLLMAEIKAAELLTVFNHKRQQYYTICSEARRYAREHSLPVPELPIAPASHFPNARPRNRWLSLSSVS